MESILNPLLQYLSIKRINLNHAYVTLNDRSVPDPIIYKLKDFNFYATRFLVDDSTNRSGGLFFACDHFGFSFKDFDNYLPGKPTVCLSGKVISLYGKRHIRITGRETAPARLFMANGNKFIFSYRDSDDLCNRFEPSAREFASAPGCYFAACRITRYSHDEKKTEVCYRYHFRTWVSIKSCGTVCIFLSVQ